MPSSSASRAARVVAAGRQPERFHHLPRVGDLQPQDVLVGERTVAQLGHPLGVVHQPHVLVGGRLGRRRNPRAPRNGSAPAGLAASGISAREKRVRPGSGRSGRGKPAGTAAWPGPHQCVSDCSAVTTATLKMSSAEQPRERSLAGFASPCRNGPMAIAPPKPFHQLVADVGGRQVGKDQRIGTSGHVRAGRFALSHHQVTPRRRPAVRHRRLAPAPARARCSRPPRLC